MTFTKPAAVAIAVTLWTSLSAPSTMALADPELPATATQSYAAYQFHSGDLVHLRSGGPLMTVTVTFHRVVPRLSSRGDT